ncbi:deoxycytidylate deaminase isoform X1 [Passer domesticus]|uniref:deoxycytidylate deaminase isoform X1 n=3 Tax=Passer TaxID=9159 RepID=UPI0030FE8750
MLMSEHNIRSNICQRTEQAFTWVVYGVAGLAAARGRAPGAGLPGPGSRGRAPGAGLPGPGSRGRAPGAGLPGPGSRGRAPGAGLPGPGSRGRAPGAGLPPCRSAPRPAPGPARPRGGAERRKQRGRARMSGPRHNGTEASCKKREDYLEWPEYFMAVAFLSAQRSKDPSSQVGACIVNSENKIVGIGYNGMPNGCSDDVLPWTRTGENRLDTKYPYVCHAELNAIMNKNSADVKGCSMYVALFPCNECAKLIIQAGIKEVIFMSDKYHDTTEMTAARRMFDLAGIIYREFKPKCNKIIIDFDSINSRPSQKLL